MKIDVITLFPQMFSCLNASITGKAQKDGLLQLRPHNLRSFSQDKHRTVDAPPFGGESGMVLQAGPIRAALSQLNPEDKARVVFLTPQGKALTQDTVKKLAARPHLILLCGHYKGVDERIRQKYVHEEISTGDYVLTGGELPAMILVDAVTRLIPGVFGESMASDSFFESPRLGWPVYTRPELFDGMEVPKVLLSGHHEKMRQWRLAEGLKRTRERRPELFKGLKLTKEEKKLLSMGP